MPTHYTNCLYVHGLHSNVNKEKVSIMEKYFSRVTARHIIYNETPDTYQILKEMCKKENVDFIVGSSFGGYLGFYLSRELQLPCILFNPALFYSDEDNNFITNVSGNASPFSLFVLGELDDVVSRDSIDHFMANNSVEDNIKRITCSWLPHRIDIVTFEAMISSGIVLSKSVDDF